MSAVWLDPEGTERSQSFKNKAAADKHWVRMEAEVERGEYVDANAGKAEFDAIARRWLTSRAVDESTKIRYESVYRLHLKPVFGHKQVKAIKSSDVQGFQGDLSERFSQSTVTSARLVLLGILDLAVADELIRKNPAMSPVVQRSQASDGERVIAWSQERVLSLIDAHPEHLRLLPIIGATCGLREGELFGLAEEDIDFDEGVLHVRRQLKKLGKDHVFGLPKNDRERDVPLPEWTAQHIRVHLAHHPTSPCSLPWERVDGKPRTANILFRWRDGGHLKPRAFSETAWKPALATAGIIPPPVKDQRGRRKYVTTRREGTHQLRHAYASTMLASGVSVRDLAEYLGHADPGFTLRIYAHLMPDSHERARRAIDERMFKPRAVATGTETEQP